MSVDNITAKILGDAKEYADKLTSDAKSEASGIIAKAKQEAENVKKQKEALAAKDAEIAKQRKMSVADLEVRKMQLAVKQQAVTKALDAAANALANLKPEDYVKFLSGKVAEAGVKEGQLILNKKDKEAIGAKLVEEANKLTGGKFTLADKTVDTKGGFLLRSGSVEINSTIETMINSVKEAVTPEVVKVLF